MYATVIRLIGVVFPLKIRLCSYKIAINYLLFPVLFIHSYKIHFFWFLCSSIIMDSSNIDNQSKESAFNKFKRLSCKYYLKFSKIGRVGEDLNQFLTLLSDCVPKLS